MSKLKTRAILTAFSALAVISAGFAWTTYEQSMQASLREGALTKARETSATYARVIGEGSPALQKEFVSPIQRSALAKLTDIAREAPPEDERDILEVLRHVSRMQMAAISLFELANDAGLESPSLEEFKLKMGDRGDARDLVRQYNEYARKWNMHSSSFFGSMVADIASAPGEQLPYLTYNGTQEDSMSIEL